MNFVVTLIEGANNMKFVFGTYEIASQFIKNCLMYHDGKENIAAEIEVIHDEF